MKDNQSKFGQIINISKYKLGSTFEVGESICEIEGSQARGRLLAPFPGQLIEINPWVLNIS